jgi:hypothetical protein
VQSHIGLGIIHRVSIHGWSWCWQFRPCNDCVPFCSLCNCIPHVFYVW